jgi:hypothetical protein
VIVLQIEVADLSVDDIEGDPSVPRNRDAPGPGTVADKPMNPPAGRALNPAHVRCADQHGKDVPHPADQIVPEPPVIVVFDKASQTLMTDAPNLHSEMYGHAVRYVKKCAVGSIGFRWILILPNCRLALAGRAPGRVARPVAEPSTEVD